jgi:hypothetical protein
MSHLDAALLEAVLRAYVFTSGLAASWAAKTMGAIPISAKARMWFTDFE